jgi:2-polyprenyl-6-methoxyphenol hydroxylase-like FAD-dependent oxidoreductase
MNENAFHVAIIGGGIGGLTLAQGLTKAGINVSVYERDQAPDARRQGFRVHIDPEGSRALHECLPGRLWEIFDATGGDFGHGFTFMTEHMRELLALRRDREAAIDDVARHRSISRITLRHVLLNGLEHRTYFNKRFLHYERSTDGRLQIHFADGSNARADVLVGADGVNSGVRKQYLPNADPVDTGVLALAGKVPLSAGVMALAPPNLLDGPVMVMPPSPCSLFMALWKRSSRAREPLRRLGIEEPIAGDEDYLILGFGARPEYLSVNGDADFVTGAAMKDAMRRMVASWHPNLRKLVELAEEETMTVTQLRTSLRQAPWKTTAITLLGDAIHSMTPYRGIGANVALRDAALLCAKLREVQNDGKPLQAAIGEYEEAMRDYGFAAVEASRKAMEQAVGARSKPAFGIFKTAMRVANAVPVLKRKLIPA